MIKLSAVRHVNSLDWFRHIAVGYCSPSLVCYLKKYEIHESLEWKNKQTKKKQQKKKHIELHVIQAVIHLVDHLNIWVLPFSWIIIR